MSPVARVGVLGCGLMGSGIAETSARRGCDVLVVEVSAGAVTTFRCSSTSTSNSAGTWTRSSPAARLHTFKSG
ncbi:3-hydroxyacyl-CoA dehydrogenase NAD-binding domain-containing protein [Streptomyces sp. NPDC008137]|uniref:3-hydroxyacyl-CoA dehydrogenase NAD-binding domain-containing protein n=1 Tax=Streptomyces sp. NPDC008137 TaxID=3364813 RepID=UPI0036EABB16